MYPKPLKIFGPRTSVWLARDIFALVEQADDNVADQHEV
jgi:hypothetical protein